MNNPSEDELKDNSATPDSSNSFPEQPKSPRSKGRFLGFLALLVSLLALGASVYLWQLQQQSRRVLSEETRTVAQNNLAQVHNLTVKVDSQEKMLHHLMSLSEQEDKKTALLLAQQGEHLLTLAQYSLAFENNSGLAIKLVLSADQKLQEANDPALTQVRSELANTIVALNATPKVDITGLVARIDAISNQVGNLSIVPAGPQTTQLSSHKNLTWKDKLFATLKHLQGLVSIRRLQEPVQPLASPEQHLYLLETIRLKLAQAQWAVLHQNPELYLRSLDSVKKNLNQYYSKNPVGVSLISMVTELQQVNVKPAMPDLTSVLSQLRQYITSAQPQPNSNPAKPSETLPAPAQPSATPAPTSGALPS